MKSKSNKQKIYKITTTSVLAALSIVLMFTVRFSIFPVAPFYEMEFADVPILICSWLFGPVYALVSLLVVCVIQSITVSGTSGLIGFFMHFLSSGLLIIILSLFKKPIVKTKGIKNILFRILASIAGIMGVIAVMIPMNIWQASIFMNMSAREFAESFLWVCIAFNAIKAGSNVIIYNILSPQLLKVYNKLFKI